MKPKTNKKKKRFISKKEATTYRLIPGYVDDESPEMLDKEEIEARKEEQRKYGIFFEDSYNYMKHLRSLTEQAALVNYEQFQLLEADQPEPRSITNELPVFKGHLSVDKTEEILDTDVLAALENAPVVKFDDREMDNFLDDDFIVQAGGVAPEEFIESDLDYSYSESESCNNEDDVKEDNDEQRSSESSKAHSIGSVQNEIVEAQTALILKNFEEGLGFQYSGLFSDDEKGEVTTEDYEKLKQIIMQDKITENPQTWIEVLNNKEERSKIDTSCYLYDDEDEFELKEVPLSERNFDCVSILSLNSNTRNLPKDLIPPKVKTSRRKIENEIYRNQGLSLKELGKEIHQSRAEDKVSTLRPKCETTEERKTRKKAIKEERKERRQEKKANREVFALENEKIKKEMATLHKSVKSIRIC